VPSIDLGSLQVDPVLTKASSLLWNAYIERHHYLGHQPMPGAQLRYFVRGAGHILAALGFGASAWKVKPRDQVIGWTRGGAETSGSATRISSSTMPASSSCRGSSAKPGFAHPRLGEPTTAR
jgi:hypothetical protein